MEIFIWNTAISFQLLFIIVSGGIFIYVRKKSFKYYMLYNISLLIYLLSRNDHNYYAFESELGAFLGPQNAEVFTSILSYFIQVVFYHFYSIFALYFLDINKHLRKYFRIVVRSLRLLTAALLIAGIGCYILQDTSLYIAIFAFVFLPVILSIFFITVIRAIRHSGKHKYLFLIGVSFYVIFALMAFAGTFIPELKMRHPINYFFIGIIIETIFFTLGLAYKVKIINDEKNRVRHLVTKHKHQQQISKLNGLLEGEEKERKRIAQELHDGIASDLSAIKMNIAFLNQGNKNGNEEEILAQLSQTIDKSCVQIREISHNLSPSSITNFGLVIAVKNFCCKVENLYNIKINFTCTGEEINLKSSAETHIYRIIQELVNNIVKHAEATLATVAIQFQNPYITVLVSDNGIGFSSAEVSKGIGLSNIESRIRFLDAVCKRVSNETGTSCTFIINVNQINYLKK